MYPRKELLDVIDDMLGVTDVLAVPWVLDEVRPWVRQWNVAELGGAASVAPQRLMADPVAEAAVAHIVDYVNCADALSHDGDRSATISVFRILKSNDVPFDPEEVRAWVMTHPEGHARLADAIADIARGVLQGKHYLNVEAPWRDDMIETWRARAARGDSTP